MTYRKYLLHYHSIQQSLAVVVAIGTALLFSYLLLQARL
jgi:putative flippase GtrA